MSIGNTSCEVLLPTNDLQDVKDIERSIIKTYRKELWSKFIKAINEYEMIQDNDKIAIAISGGKDSLLLAKLFQELQKYSKQKFEIEFIVMDPGFSKENIDQLKINCKHLNIPVKIKESRIFEVIGEIAKDYPCYMCARMRRGFLYSFAEELGCNKLALGHHFDDIIETTLINVFYASTFKTMLPKLKAANFDGIELIRPMSFIKENDIKRFTKNNGLLTMNCGCIVAAGKTSSKRKEIKDLIANLRKINPNIDKSIYESANNVNLESILGYVNDGKKYDVINKKSS